MACHGDVCMGECVVVVAVAEQHGQKQQRQRVRATVRVRGQVRVTNQLLQCSESCAIVATPIQDRCSSTKRNY